MPKGAGALVTGPLFSIPACCTGIPRFGAGGDHKDEVKHHTVKKIERTTEVFLIPLHKNTHINIKLN